VFLLPSPRAAVGSALSLAATIPLPNAPPLKRRESS
jgi:hypothetical protein